MQMHIKTLLEFHFIYYIIYNILYLDTRQRNNLYLPQANLTIYQKGAYYLGIKFVNNLPLEIKNVAGNQKNLKLL
jgi:hypothetical protein